MPKSKPFIIDDSTSNDILHPEGYATGYDPGSVGLMWSPQTQELESAVLPMADIEIIPRSEWSARIKEREEKQMRMRDIRGRKPIYDQQQNGYCWSYGPHNAATYARFRTNKPRRFFNPCAIAAIIMSGRDQGAWSGLALKAMTEIGMSPLTKWPGTSRDTRNDTPELRQEMKKFKVQEAYFDATKHPSEQYNKYDVVFSALLLGIPLSLDWMQWGHATSGLDPVEFEPGAFGIDIENSWANWGDNGWAVIPEQKWEPTNAVGVRVI